MLITKSFCKQVCFQFPSKNVQRGWSTNVMWKSVPGCQSSLWKGSLFELHLEPRWTV